ncbi:hypothetical protein [Pseudonocardia xishanensis]|uniref:Uncharacterized protein n=1 Tax=Pseudonocardia xishanensis TaxID=630995 RepID=A0ABP8S1B8_9PSEU
MFERLRSLFGRPETAEDDVRPDTATARTRETGGRDTDSGDSATTTGTGASGEFVGRVAGQDAGADDSGVESGAEARRRET